MKIVAFEVRADEQAEFARQAKLPDIELKLRSDALSADTLDACNGADAVLILGRMHYDEQLLAAIKARGVNCLVTRSIGMDHIDLDAAQRLGIAVSNISYAPDSVADFTIMLLLIALRKYKPALYRQNVNDYSLAGLQGRTLSSLTVGVIGAGRIGRAVLERLSGFGCKLLAYGPSGVRDVPAGVQAASLEDLLAQSDVVSFHVPLTSETQGMVDADFIARMRDGVVLVNTARGELMDVPSLIEGIETGKIGALAMDVFTNEGSIYHHSLVNDIVANRDMAYLRQFPNTVLTQHMAFYTEQAVGEMVSHAIEAARRLCAE
ncbi:NAD(P)-dependent oxidoreductase [Olegusella massiliensis]|uniref:NAD(P)-dependent oxidoreductase n=1 Tax=Olegusella massiliensis TaxID=1776381 RepID=UPI000838C414|nr:NAD(P)-dependent oxidoreductase [Olegusella massiliensis]